MIMHRDGIFRVGDEGKGSGYRPVVLVHPWFIDGERYVQTIFPEGVERVNSLFVGETYRERINEIIRRCPGHVVVLEEHDKLDRAQSEISFGGNAGDRFIVPTKWGAPDPLKTTWDGFVEFLNCSSVLLGGGYLTYSDTDFGIGVGCLGVTQRKLSERKIDGKFIEDFCFSY